MEGRTGKRPGAVSGDVPLVGRRPALQAAEEALRSAAKGAFRFLALFGDPGAGKTRLLGEFSGLAASGGLRVLAGRAAEFEQQIPFGALVDALDDHLDDLLDDHRAEFDEATVRLLARVFPALMDAAAGDAAAARAAGDGAAGDGAAGDGRADFVGVARYQLHRAVRRLLEVVAAPSGLVLLLDDVHWADDATIELLDYLVRHPPRARVLVAAAYRPAQTSPRLATLVGAAGEHGLSVSVDPLTRPEVEEFLGPNVSRSRCQALYEASGGNPFYLEALARPGPAGGAPGAEGPLSGLEDLPELPPAVRTALQMELSALPAGALLVARAAAVAADEFEPALAAATAQMPEDAALEALDELVARDVVRPVAAGRFQFRHPLVRHVAYGSAAAGWRLAAHARIARHLAALGAPATLRAHHVERSAHYGDQEAITTLIDAARTVAAQAPATAAHWLAAALRLMPEDGERGPGEPRDGRAVPPRVELLLELAHVQTVGGRLLEGRESARTLLRLLPAADHERRARAVQLCAVIERLLHRHQEARALVLDELRKIPDPQAPAAVLLRVRLVADRLMRVDVRGAQAVLDRMPDRAPDWAPGLEVAVASMRALPAYAAGRVADAIGYAEAADRVWAAAPDSHLAECLDSVPWLCWSESMMGRYGDALRHLDRSLAVARATGQASFITYLLTARARTLTSMGRLAEAADPAEEATEVARMLRSAEALVFGLTQQCLVASWSGDHDLALRLGAEAVRNDVGAGEWWGAMAGYSHGVALVNSGDPERGAASIVAACGDAAEPKLDPATLISCCELMAQVESGRDRPDEALKWAELAELIAHPELRGDTALAALARAHALQGKDPGATAEIAGEAARALLLAERPIDAGRAELAAGLAHAAVGTRDVARARLRAAAELFAGCGAKALHAQAVREQRRLGVRVAGGRGAGRGGGPFGLSPREQEIAGLVSKGYTNQQVAERLFLSVRTVETHLSRVFTKLGVSSRVGVATALNRPDEGPGR